MSNHLKTWARTATCLLLSSTAFAQDPSLPARIRAHMTDEFAHLPNYTCVETAVRSGKDAGTPRSQKLQARDTVKLEVVYSNHREWYGSPGAHDLNAGNPSAFTGSGLMGTGAFAMIVNNIIRAATLSYRGDETVSGRSIAKFDFHLPPSSGLALSVRGGSGTAGLEGSLWVDTQSLDLIRLESTAVDFPASLPVEAASVNASYARVPVGAATALLAQHAEMRLLENSGQENRNQLDFTQCRAYSAESAVRFDTALPETAATPVPDSHISSIVPALLMVSIQPTSPITGDSAVGTLVEGRVSAKVVYKGKLLIPAGAAVRGRIRRLERFQQSGFRGFIVGIEFTEVEAIGSPMRLYGDLVRIEGMLAAKRVVLSQVAAPVRSGSYQTNGKATTLPELPGVASFFIEGSHFAFPSSLRLVLRSRGPLHGIE